MAPITGPALPDEDDDHDRGLPFDLGTIVNRRRAVLLLAGAGAVALIGCGSDDTSTKAASSSSSAASSSSSTPSSAAGSSSSAPSTSSATATTATRGPQTAIPEETAGPYPGDGSNGPNVLDDSGIVRRDITTSFGSASGTATGVPLTVNLTVVDAATGAAMPGAAVYLWHCDQAGRYSLYSSGATDQNYLRGVQQADANGQVTFASIFPAAYSGRWPHIHFEVYASVADATSSGAKLATSQLALPEATCNEVYATSGYEQSITNMKRTTLASDMVFRDGYAQQTPTMTGAVGRNLAAHLTVPV